MSDIEYTYSITNDFDESITSPLILDFIRMKNEITIIITPNDYDNIVFGVNGIDQVIITFINKQTLLTTQNETDLNNYIANYTQSSYNKYSENVKYDAVVSNDPYSPARYSSIEQALADHKKCIFVKGTRIPYTISSNIILNNNTKIYGESYGDVILNFAGQTGYNIMAIEHTTTTSGDSVTFTNGSTTVTGVNTSFYTDLITNGNTDNNTGFPFGILVYSRAYEVASIVDNTTLTLTTPYIGPTQTFDKFLVGRYNDKIVLKNLILAYNNHPDCTMCLGNVVNLTLEDIVVVNCNNGESAVHIDSGYLCNFNRVKIFQNNSVGLLLDDVLSSNLFFFQSYTNTGAGLHIKSDNYYSNGMSINNSYIEFNNQGIVLGNNGITGNNHNSNIHIVDTKIRNNFNEGIVIYNSGVTGVYNPLTNSSYGNNINGCEISFNGGIGATINSESTKITNCCIGFNTKGVLVRNKENIISNNFICYNNEGVCACPNIDNNVIPVLNKLNICGNTIKANKNGIDFMSNTIENCNITNNMFSGNTGYDISISPATTTTSFTSKNYIINSNNLEGDIFIGGKTGATGNVENVMITNNFINEIVTTSQVNNMIVSGNMMGTVYTNTNGNTNLSIV